MSDEWAPGADAARQLEETGNAVPEPESFTGTAYPVCCPVLGCTWPEGPHNHDVLLTTAVEAAPAPPRQDARIAVALGLNPEEVREGTFVVSFSEAPPGYALIEWAGFRFVSLSDLTSAIDLENP